MNFGSNVLIAALTLIAVAGIIFWAAAKEKFGDPVSVPTPPPPPSPQMLEEYMEYGRVLCAVINSNYMNCGLCKPTDIPQHLAPNGQGIVYTPGRWFYAYQFDRSVRLLGGLKQEYSTLAIQKMADILNPLLPNYCIANGLAPAKIVGGKNLPNGRVTFFLGLL